MCLLGTDSQISKMTSCDVENFFLHCWPYLRQGKSTGHRWIPLINAELWRFSCILAWTIFWTNTLFAGDLRHQDVNVTLHCDSLIKQNSYSIAENLRFDQFCDSIRALFGTDIHNQDLKALYRKISTNPDAKVDWSEASCCMSQYSLNCLVL